MVVLVERSVGDGAWRIIVDTIFLFRFEICSVLRISSNLKCELRRKGEERRRRICVQDSDSVEFSKEIEFGSRFNEF